MKAPLKGLKHYSFQEIQNTLRSGFRVSLSPELDNKFDSYAVAAFHRNFKLGYLPAGQKIIFDLLAQYAPLDTVISGIYTDLIDPQVMVEISIKI